MLNELKTGGPLQATIAAVIVASVVHRNPAGTAHAVWPYLVIGYGFLAATMPWIVSISGGLVNADDFSGRAAIFFAGFVAIPMWFAAESLANSPYYALSIVCRVLFALACLHVLLDIGQAMKRGEKWRRE